MDETMDVVQVAPGARGAEAKEAVALALDKIRVDGGTQPRAKIDQHVVEEYVEAMRGGAVFPPVVVFLDGVDHWLADGFHRCHAARAIGLTEIRAELRSGTKRDAILFSTGANEAHGLRRTHADKRRAVEMLLLDPEWRQNSDRWIGDQAKVGHSLVAKLRAELATPGGSGIPAGTRRKTRDGRLMDTSKIKRSNKNRRKKRRWCPGQLTSEQRAGLVAQIQAGQTDPNRLKTLALRMLAADPLDDRRAHVLLTAAVACLAANENELADLDQQYEKKVAKHST